MNAPTDYRLTNRLPSLALALSIIGFANPVLGQANEADAKATAIEAKVTEWGKRLERTLRTGAAADAKGLLDCDRMAKAAIEGIKLGSAKARQQVTQGTSKGLAKQEAYLLEQWSRGQAKFKTALTIEGVPHARFRFVIDDGIAIIDMALREEADSWRVIDIYNHTMGMGMVEQMAQTMALALPALDTGLMSRFFGSGRISRRDISNIRLLAKHARSGKHAEGISAYGKLSEKMQHTAAATIYYVNCLAALETPEANKRYAAALEAAARRHPAPMFRFMLIDAHFINGRTDAALATIDEIVETLGPDAALFALRASLQNQGGRLEPARKDLDAAIRLEPDCLHALEIGLDIWIAAKDWKALRDGILSLEKHGDYDFKGVIHGEEWGEFAKAPESEPWR